MFSPYYSWARARGRAEPDNHCAINIALYGDGADRWAMTERGGAALEQSRSSLTIGPSTLAWEGDTLVARIHETAVPWPSLVRGEVRLHPSAITNHLAGLDPDGRHCWWPIAPVARLEAEFERPRMAWSGAAYFDSNWGTAPLEDAFSGWHWCRAGLDDGTAIFYDVTGRGSDPMTLALHFDRAGEVDQLTHPERFRLPPTRWRIDRAVRSDADHPARVIRTLEDGPFYARTNVAAGWLGKPVNAVHETLSLDRFRNRWVRLMLPFRMPRAFW